MKSETALGAAFQRAGFIAREARFGIALAEFLNNGGTIQRAHELVDMAAEKMGGEGQDYVVGKANGSVPGAPRTNDAAKGLAGVAEKAGRIVPAASPERNGAGHSRRADKAEFDAPRPVSPAYIAAAKAGAEKIARTVLDSFKVRDGRSIGDVLVGELESLRAANAMEASVLRQIQRLGYADARMPVRAIVDPDTLARMIQRAAEVADAS